MTAGPIDTCVYHRWARITEVYEYLDPDWRAYVGKPGSLPGGGGSKRIRPAFRYHNPPGDSRREARPEG